MKYLIVLFLVSIQLSNAQNFTIKSNDNQYRIHEILSQYIQQKSISGDEKVAGEWLKKLCRQNGLYITQMGNSNGNYNFSASIRPLSDHLPNIIFLNHIDVVPVGDSSKWNYPPFSGMIMGGRVWGRGAFDNKGAAVVQLASVIQSARHFKDKELPFNVTFLAVSCEETQCQGGVSYVIENHFDELNPSVVIGEGPPGLKGILETDTSLTLFGISVAHKRPFWLKLELELPTSGHGSVTPLSYSNKGMVIALSKVVSENQPIEFIEANTQLLKALGRLENGIKSSALKHPHTFKGLLVPKLRERPEVFSLMSNTVTLTSLQSETNTVNLIPTKTTALLDCRLLPNTNRNEFLANFKKSLDNDSIKVSVMYETPPMHPSSDTTNFYKAIHKAIQNNYPGAEIIPVMMPSFNDVGLFRSKGVTCYSSFPILLDENQVNSIKHIHNYDEFIPIKHLETGKNTYDEFVRILMKVN
tara:strand:- start:4 stop:1416 length:1413 start_codon:yes stop_codon:yes gene_type:complete